MLNKPGPQDFFDLKKMPDHSKQDTVVALERRHFPRYSITASAEATDVKSQTRIKARISDLGRWGCHVDTVSPFVVNTVVKIGIEKDKERFFAEARVLYSTVGMGMGLIFTVVDPAEVSILEKWIADLAETDRIPKQQLRKRLKITPRRVPSMSFAAY